MLIPSLSNETDILGVEELFKEDLAMMGGRM